MEIDQASLSQNMRKENVELSLSTSALVSIKENQGQLSSKGPLFQQPNVQPKQTTIEIDQIYEQSSFIAQPILDDQSKMLKEFKLLYKYQPQSQTTSQSPSQSQATSKYPPQSQTTSKSLSIQPVILSASPTQQLKISVQKQCQSIQDVHLLHTIDIQRKIKQLASFIRNKTKEVDANNKQKYSKLNKSQRNTIEQSLRKHVGKNQKPSFLTNLPSPSPFLEQRKTQITQNLNDSIRLNQKFLFEGEENQFDQNPQNPIIIKAESSQLNIEPFIHKIIKRDILRKVFALIDLKEKQMKYKVKFDTEKHHYPTTIFRKKIMEEKKGRDRDEKVKMEERLSILKKRKDFQNQSRYYPYGIKGAIPKETKKQIQLKLIPSELLQSPLVSQVQSQLQAMQALPSQIQLIQPFLKQQIQSEQAISQTSTPLLATIQCPESVIQQKPHYDDKFDESQME